VVSSSRKRWTSATRPLGISTEERRFGQRQEPFEQRHFGKDRLPGLQAGETVLIEASARVDEELPGIDVQIGDGALRPDLLQQPLGDPARELWLRQHRRRRAIA
jgi:hypothetical protein